MIKNYPSVFVVLLGGLAILGIGWLSLVTEDWDTETHQTSTVIQEQEIPSASDYVTDTANVIGEEEEKELNKKLKDFSESGKGEIGVLTVKNMNGLSIEEFSIRVAEKWKVGEKGLDNGVLFVLAIDERKVRIELGRGVPITDAQAGQIIDTIMVQKLSRKEYGQAMMGGVDAVIELLNKG